MVVRGNRQPAQHHDIGLGPGEPSADEGGHIPMRAREKHGVEHPALVAEVNAPPRGTAGFEVCVEPELRVHVFLQRVAQLDLVRRRHVADEYELHGRVGAVEARRALLASLARSTATRTMRAMRRTSCSRTAAPVGSARTRLHTASVAGSARVRGRPLYGAIWWHPLEKYALPRTFSAASKESSWSRDRFARRSSTSMTTYW